MAFWTYILLCADGLYYTGHTDNLEFRIAQHQSGLIEGFTSSRLPVRLMWSQDFATRYEALDAEARIKKWSRAKKEALIRGDWEAVSHFAKPPKERPTSPFASSEVEMPVEIAPSPIGVSTSLDTSGNRGLPSGGGNP
ncbi:GIY-YIG nuclease family protein [Sphingopyxis alaskensis]|jgi:predicted GIY-YIG superfamily endonuclease|uniref:Excinuclease ABC, C subunit-like protein n=1 Tax=Sphingopyxis alaskensis (strain DSM 13593 / LMG 18877 / RB2256) TaxID=317655 RepID=Q1GUH4_SPHAL|nr:GIY-YIG nuclease family protein [Sphingopyxis alaskensis]ABF52698.1 Excinuclease ABC, C subunit-like protein [Sphingopyxis alaskensis RB2256]MCM3418234.1 GIY-YIG nuclease family protein [Sphingopyxis alaskensis]